MAKGRVVKALPGTGKTHLAGARGQFVDTDALVREVTGQKPSKAFMETIRNDSEINALVREAIVSAMETGMTVLSNFDTQEYVDVPVQIDVRFDSGRDYIRHLKLVERSDLLEKFSLEELSSWNDGESISSEIQCVLYPGGFLSKLF